MAHLEDRSESNIPGRYYVDSLCIDCDHCRDHAPGFFRRDAHIGLTIVYHQPVTAAELSLCEEALLACPTESIGNDG
ncbi:MAG: ferredoxin [Verrucomicrobiaceae bacterium]|nr:ferredoxin [Verrucomicrobiaceae bacterium]